MSLRRDNLIKRVVAAYGLDAQQAQRVMYFIVYMRKGHVVMYWRPDMQGYSTNILDAGIYTFEQAASIYGDRDRNGEVQDVAIPITERKQELLDMQVKLSKLLNAMPT